ncbi:phage terminase small subunit P27 family [Dyadobacter sp. CY323]|uniref:phage terminase small subunit P27 family n=1 Tax=Dyadobacter sp. CY323 TaxID=2907302 RepID=UPI001F348368|nr:phage terminase small subunit P27 family [Dyadobacter sp. CY323]MCE6992090.1 phage terminase small subunit P27 family [Dyadobacter sp. CY323]
MGPGRPATPTAIKKLTGTFREDRANKHEMMPSVLEFAPKAPGVLSRDGKKVWDSVTQELAVLKMLHRVDLELLAAYCNEMATYWDACKAIKKEGAVIRPAKKESITIKLTKEGNPEIAKPENEGYPIQNPWVSIRNTALKNAQGLANQFGFTPAARARLRVEPPQEKDPLDEILNS